MIEKTKDEVFEDIDQIFITLQEIWKCSVKDMVYINELAGRFNILRDLSISLKAELQFINPSGGKFWARNILKAGKLNAMKSEIRRLKEQAEFLKRNKETGRKKCSEELVLLDKLINNLGLLKKELVKVEKD